MLAILLLLASLSPAHPASCDMGSTTPLVRDLTRATDCGWASAVDNALDFLTEANNPSSARYEAHALAEDVRKAEREGRLPASESAKLQDALAFIWHRSDEYESAWKAIAKGDFAAARDEAHRMADRARQAGSAGYLTGAEQKAMEELAGRVWELANQLSKVQELLTAGKRQEAMSLAHKTADTARELGSQGFLTEGQSSVVVTQAGRLYGDAKEETSSPAPSEPAHTSVPYFSQYDNGINPGGSCQNTSVAMLLSYYGVKVTPDQISSRYGTSYAQTPAGLATVFNTYANEAGISERLRAHTDGSMSSVNRLLEQGQPVIVHGYFTGYGHVLLATGRDASGYKVNDPAGVWSESFKGGYRGSYNGRGVHYGTSSFTSAIATWDGSTPAPVWYHEVYRP